MNKSDHNSIFERWLNQKYEKVLNDIGIGVVTDSDILVLIMKTQLYEIVLLKEEIQDLKRRIE